MVKDKDGKSVYPATSDPVVGKRVASPQASYIITDILSGNTVKSINPIWGQWQIIDKSGKDSVRLEFDPDLQAVGLHLTHPTLFVLDAGQKS